MHRIRTRLVVAILAAALVPAVPATLLVHSLLQRSQNIALEQTLADGLEAGMEESRLALTTARLALIAASDSLAAAGASGVWTIDHRGRITEDLAPPPFVLAAAVEAGDRPRLAGDWLVWRRVTDIGDTLLTAQLLPEGAVRRAERLAEGLAMAAALRQDRSAILRSYVLPFIVVYAALLLAALGLAALLARGVVEPLSETARAADRVAQGDLSVRVATAGPGEVGALVRAFNAMVGRLEQQRRELARLERMAAWRNLARVLAHEIKNPLTPILMAVQEARSNYRGDDRDHTNVLETCETIVREEVAGLHRLVASFSDFARMPKTELQDEDLRMVIEDLERLYGERLTAMLPSGPLPCRCDAEALRRALVNLIDNGLGACARCGRPEVVVLSAAAAPDCVILSVADEGDGIPPENLERVFDPDFSTRGGMGLGLAIARGVVEGHSGTIELESACGRGTTATIKLPAVSDEGAP